MPGYIESKYYRSPLNYIQNEVKGAARIILLEEDYTKLKSLQTKIRFESQIFDQCMRPDYIDLDFLIQGVSFQYMDFNKLEPHIGDSFSLHFFGKSPITLNISGILLETANNNSKYIFTKLYQEVFRISKVVKYKIVPIIKCLDCAIAGAFLTMQLEENAQAEGVIQVSCSFLVFNLYIFNKDNEGRFNSLNMIYDKESDLHWSEIQPSSISSVLAGTTLLPSSKSSIDAEYSITGTV
jgi:hypothetical protein